MGQDDYFQTCWLTLKAMRPRLAKQMDYIEIKVFGIKVTEKKPKKKVAEDKKSTKDKQEPVIV
jgi:hypothetical protein